MSTHNICFYGELMKIILQLSSNTHLTIAPLCKSGGFTGFALSWHSVVLSLCHNFSDET